MNKRESARENHIRAGLGIVVLLVSLPMILPGIEGRFGQDLGFHLMRIEGLAAELQNGVFPIKIESLWMEGYGYPVSVYYGDFLLYFPAILRLLGVPVIVAYKIFVLIVNLLSGWIAYKSFLTVFQKRDAAFVSMAAYISSAYRMTNLYVRAAVGEYCAMMFLPLIMAAVYLLYTEDLSEKKARVRTALLLALGMSGVIGTHILTTELLMVVLVMVALLLWKKTFSAPVLKTYLRAAFTTVVLNLYFIVPFLHYYLLGDANIRHKVGEAQKIQSNGITIRRYLAIFDDPFLRGAGSGERIVVTPGLVLLCALFVAVAFVLLKKKDVRLRVGVLLSLTLLFLASSYFPWDWAAERSRAVNMLAQIQFPWRYIGPATVLLSMLLGAVIINVQSLRKKQIMVTAALCMIGGMCVVFFGFYQRSAQRVDYTERAELDTYDMGFIEYLPYGVDRDAFSHRLEYTGSTQARISQRRGTNMTVSCYTEEGTTLTFPLIHYIGYQVRDEQGKVYPIIDSDQRLIQVVIDGRFDGNLYVTFRQPWFWIAAECISAAGFAATFWEIRRVRRS